MARTKQTSRIATTAIVLDNLTPNETIHQRAILLKGHIALPPSAPASSPTYITITTTATDDDDATPTFPPQTCPVHSAHFSALVLLTPGPNILHLHAQDDHYTATLTTTLTYLPLLQHPPLHLAILIASDSPLLMDCPPSKGAGLSSTHNSLAAATAKLRMAAYAWQALTAESLRGHDLSRRSFRLDEEWGADTTSSAFLSSSSSSSSSTPLSGPSSPYRATAKVHLVRTPRSVADLRRARHPRDIHAIFRAALEDYGGPFAAAPGMPPPAAAVSVAGLVLDAHYDERRDRVLGHAAVGNAELLPPLDQRIPGRKRSGRPGAEGLHDIRLAAFGSHTCWAWPRFVEEVAACCADGTACRGAGGSVPRAEDGAAWEACAGGMGAMLREMGRAWGCAGRAGSTPPPGARALERWQWAKLLSPGVLLLPIARSASVFGEEGVWSLADALRLRCLPQFRVPGDDAAALEEMARGGEPAVEACHAEGAMRLRISAEGGLARIAFGGRAEDRPSVARPAECWEFDYEELEARFGRTGEPLQVTALAVNGKERVVGNVWALFGRLSCVKVPGSALVLQKRSVMSEELEAYDSQELDRQGREFWEWAALLKERSANGKLTHAKSWDIRVGCILDGGVLYYQDGHHTNLGPRVDECGSRHEFGGHASEEISLSADNDIVKIEVHRSFNELVGMRVTLADGTVRGELHENGGWGQKPQFVTLEPGPEERIVGFFGRSDWKRSFNGMQEFGIITAPKDFGELPDTVYDMEELKNTDGGIEEVRQGLKSGNWRFHEEDEDRDEDISDEEWADGRS